MRKKERCKGPIKYKEGQVLIDCSGCEGSSDLSDRICFREVSQRILPGFSGEVILSSEEERGYSGIIVETMESYSEILVLFDGILDGAGKKGNDIKKALMDSRNRYLEDPSDFLKRSKKVRKNLEGSKRGRELVPLFERIVDRCDLMIRRLETIS
jgi:hypothetical protein